MWKSKYRCFVIRNRYVCTKDRDLAKVYSLIKRASVYIDMNGSFATLLKDIIDGFELFAQKRRLLDEPLYAEVRKALTVAYDTYTLFDTEIETARDILMDSICDFQKLEELADQLSPSVDTEKGAGGYDAKLNYREVRVRATHVTRDMSMGNTYDKDYYADIDLCNREEKSISLNPLDGGSVELLSVKEDAVTMQWNDEEFVVTLGSSVSTEEIFIDNPHLSTDSLRLTFTYRELPNYTELWNMIVALGSDESEGKEARYILANRKEEILHFIDKAIEKGNTGLYVAKALLSVYNSWATCKIDNIRYFRERLREGIGHGCLAPDNYFGWEWMEVAAKYNDPSDFMEDMELYREVVETAAGQGMVAAIDLLHTLWETE